MTSISARVSAAGLADLLLSAQYTVGPTKPYAGGPVDGALPWQHCPKDDLSESGPNGPWAAFPQQAAKTVYAGDIVLGSQAPQDFKNLILTGKITNNRPTGAKWDRFFNCDIIGHPQASAYTYSTGLIDSTAASAGKFEAWDNLFRPQAPNENMDAILGHDYVVGRNIVEDCVDGFGIFSTHGPDDNVYAYANVMHKSAVFLKSSHTCNGKSPGPTHNDALAQPQGGNNWVLQWNTTRGWADLAVADGAAWIAGCAKCSETPGTMPEPNTNSCVMMNGNTAYPTNSGAYIIDNDFDGGRICLNLSALGNNKPMILEAVARNKFGPHTSLLGGKAMHIGKSKYVTIKDSSGNILYDGTPVVIGSVN